MDKRQLGALRCPDRAGCRGSHPRQRRRRHDPDQTAHDLGVTFSTPPRLRPDTNEKLVGRALAPARPGGLATKFGLRPVRPGQTLDSSLTKSAVVEEMLQRLRADRIDLSTSTGSTQVADRGRLPARTRTALRARSAISGCPRPGRHHPPSPRRAPGRGRAGEYSIWIRDQERGASVCELGIGLVAGPHSATGSSPAPSPRTSLSTPTTSAAGSHVH